LKPGGILMSFRFCCIDAAVAGSCGKVRGAPCAHALLDAMKASTLAAKIFRLKLGCIRVLDFFKSYDTASGKASNLRERAA
jgi:hypothetical protein